MTTNVRRLVYNPVNFFVSPQKKKKKKKLKINTKKNHIYIHILEGRTEQNRTERF